MLPILIMDAAKAKKKAFWLAAKMLTYVIVVAPGEEPLGGPQVFVVFVVECVGHGHVEIDRERKMKTWWMMARRRTATTASRRCPWWGRPDPSC